MIDITIVTGLYGSGKSEFTLQYAIHIAKTKQCKVFIADLDVVNIYFRSREQAKYLEQYDIEILGNVLGNDVNTDVPHLSANFYNALAVDNAHLIVDLTGDEAGLKMIRAFLEDLVSKNQGKYEFLYVANIYRDGNETSEQLNHALDYTNLYSSLKLTGLVNNSHLMEYTTTESLKAGEELLLTSNLDIKYTLVNNSFVKASDFKGIVINFDQVLLKKYL